MVTASSLPALPDYAELRCISNFTFLTGASSPEELVLRAKGLGYSALALTDECSLAGIVRAHGAAKETGLTLLVGAQFEVADDEPFTLTVLVCNLNGYGNLCEFITRLRRSSEKGHYQLARASIQGADLADCVVLVSPGRTSSTEQLLLLGHWTLLHFSGRSRLRVAGKWMDVAEHQATGSVIGKVQPVGGDHRFRLLGGIAPRGRAKLKSL